MKSWWWMNLKVFILLRVRNNSFMMQVSHFFLWDLDVYSLLWDCVRMHQRLIGSVLLQFQELHNIAATEGQVVVLECRVRGAPPLQVKWFRQGSEIQDSPDFRILQKSKKGCPFSQIQALSPLKLQNNEQGVSHLDELIPIVRERWGHMWPMRGSSKLKLGCSLMDPLKTLGKVLCSFFREKMHR